jgi:hypothetical protein
MRVNIKINKVFHLIGLLLLMECHSCLECQMVGIFKKDVIKDS